MPDSSWANPAAVLSAVCPASALNLPAAQGLHPPTPAGDGVEVAWAFWSPYVPAEHGLHCDSAVAPWAELYRPFSQGLQKLALDLPFSSRYLPPEHDSHDALPVSVWNRPSLQSLHAEAELWPLNAFAFPLSHVMQSDTSSTPTAALYLPTGHSVH